MKANSKLQRLKQITTLVLMVCIFVQDVAAQSTNCNRNNKSLRCTIQQNILRIGYAVTFVSVVLICSLWCVCSFRAS